MSGLETVTCCVIVARVPIVGVFSEVKARPKADPVAVVQIWLACREVKLVGSGC